MEVRGRSRKNKGRVAIRRRIKAWMSMVLTAAMIMGNMAASVNTVLASPSVAKEEFRLRAAAIQKAAEKALDEGNAVTEEILLDGKDKNVLKEYQEMLKADGRLYELDILKDLETVKDVNGVTLRVFMRLPEEADPKTHVLTGEEELYFLYVNDGDESVTARLNIEGLISGFSTVRPYEAVFGEKEQISENQEAIEEGSAAETEETEEGKVAEENVETAEGEESKPAGGNGGGSGSGSSGSGSGGSGSGNSENSGVHPSEGMEGTEAIKGTENKETNAAEENVPGKTEDGEEKKEDSGNSSSETKDENTEQKTENAANSETDTDTEHKTETDTKTETENKTENGDKTENKTEEKGNTGASDDGEKKDSSHSGTDKGDSTNQGDSADKAETSGQGSSSGGTENAGSTSGNTDSSSKDSSSDKNDSSEKGSSSDKGSSSEKDSSSDKNSSSDKDSSSGKSETSDKGSSGSSNHEGSSEKSSSSENKGDSDHKDSAGETAYNGLGISLNQILRVAEPEGLAETEAEVLPETEPETKIEDTAAEDTVEEETETEAEETEAEAEESSEETIPETEETEIEEDKTEDEGSATEETSEVIGEVPEIIEGTSEISDETLESSSINEENRDDFNDKEDEEEFTELEDGEDTEAEEGTVKEEEKDPFEKKGVLEGKTYNLVAFESGLTARAFVTTLDKLGMSKEDLTEGGHILTYTISPAGSAVLIDAPELVRDESEIIFGVVPQVGYRITGVTANGEILEKVNREDLASGSNAEKENDEYVKENTEYFKIPSVLESQEIEIMLEEETAGSHPAFQESKTVNGVTVTVTAGEGILPEGTYLTVEEVTEKVENAVKENIKAEKETEVQSVIAYDINLMLNGKKLSNASWSGNYVNVEFSGERIEELKQNGESIEIAPLETPVQEVEAADGGTETMPLLEDVQAEDIRIKEDEVTLIQEEEGDSIQITAEHFTVYVITSSGSRPLELSGSANVYYLNENGDVEINTENYLYLTKSDVTFTYGSQVNSKDIELTLLDGTSGKPIHVYYKNGSTVKEIERFETTRTGRRNSYKYTVTAYDSSNQWSTDFTSSSTDYSENFYWIVDKPEGHRVEWYINGELDQVTYVQTGDSPVAPYADESTIIGKRGVLVCSSNTSKKITDFWFKGWATRPNSKEYSKDNLQLNETGEVTKYYAIFSYKALFYIILPNTDVTVNTGSKYYMYAGPDEEATETKEVELYGEVIIPDSFDKRWYAGTEQLPEIDSLIITDTTDSAIREGLSRVYDDYKETWTYKTDWIVLTVAYDSVNYDGKVVDSDAILHVDGSIGVTKKEMVNITYIVAWPNETTSTSVAHVPKSTVNINSTVKEGKFTTDGIEYEFEKTYNGETYYFDGWYENQVYTDKAPDDLVVENAVTYYARYTPMDRLTYHPNGGNGEPYSVKGQQQANLTVDANSFTRPGYKFVKWNTKADGTGDDYKPGSMYTLTSEVDVLYAQWEQLTGSFVVKKILKDGTVFTNADVANVTFQLYTADKTWSTEISDDKKFGSPVTMTGEQQKDSDGKSTFGVFNFSGLPVGYYYLHEETTTGGYKLLTQNIKIEIRQNGDSVYCICHDYNNQGEWVSGEWQLTDKDQIPITNEPAYTTVLPDTGGPGVGLIKEFGWVLLLLALMMAGMEVQYYGERRRKVRVDEIRMDEQRYEEP